MSSVTAQVVVGDRGNFDDGIRPAYAVFLNENDRPALLLRSIDPYGDDRQKGSDTVWVWVPTIEHTLEDAILMIAVYVLRNEEVLSRLSELGFDPEKGVRSDRQPVELYSTFTEEQRAELYGLCRSLPEEFGLLVTVLDSSAMSRQLSCLADYSMEVRVCQQTYSRFNAAFSEGMKETGSLPPAGS